MCGIFGIIGRKIPKTEFVDLVNLLAHRGPDDAGIYQTHLTNLGHRRLSIIDLSGKGCQPMNNGAQDRWLVFNGEIYNYIELKKELEPFYTFQTRTDSEVILAAYHQWGELCVDHFNGMFAFAIWDEREKKLFCARDRFGIKPFFYAIGPQQEFLFSSEIKPLFSAGIPRQMNDRTIATYLANGIYYHSEETFFKNILLLSPGCTLTYQAGQIEIHRYWDIAKKAKIHDGIDRADAVKEFRELFSDAVRLRLRSDVPIGLHLSGGLDSSSLFVMIDRLLEKGQPMTAYTHLFGDPKYDEDIHVSALKNLNADWQLKSVLFPQNQLWDLARELTWKMESPYGGFSTIGYYFMNKVLADNGVKVLFEGQGVDEILAGYAYYQIPPTSSARYQDGTLLPSRDFLDPKIAGLDISFPMPFESSLLNRQYRDINFTKLPRVLNFNDRATMAYGKELRVPFLDYRLVEFCFALPEAMKFSDGHSKRLLRDAMDGFLPDAFRFQPKRAVVNPQREWLQGHLKGDVVNLFTSSSFKRRSWWDAKKVLEAFDTFCETKAENSVPFWALINLEFWCQSFIDHFDDHEWSAKTPPHQVKDFSPPPSPLH